MTNTELQVKHTPAPWAPFILDMTLAEIPAYIAKCISASSSSDFYFVAGRDERGDVDIAHVGNGPRGAENARLIAAAPELLESLQNIVIDYTPKDGSDKRALEAAKSAIAKALGEQA